MLNLRPSLGSLKSQLEALRIQFLSLTDDPAAIAELDQRIAALQTVADSYPSSQAAIAALQTAIAQSVSQEQMHDVATQEMVANLQTAIDAIKVPDTSGLASKSQLADVAATIPDVSGLASKTAVEQVNARIPNVSDLASKTALSAIEAKIPSVAGLATSASVDALSARIPDVSGLASKESVTQLAARIPDTSGLAPKSQVEAVAEQVSKIVVPKAAATPPPKTDLVEQVGASERYAREDHTHKARIKRATVTIGQNGYATWTFPEPFASVPVVSHMVQEQAGANRVNVIITSVSETSVTVYADRLRNLPVLNPVVGGLTALLSAVITGVNNLVTALSGFNLSGGPTSAIGVKVHMMAAEPTS